MPGGTLTVTRLPATVGTSTFPPRTASGMLIGTSIRTSLPSRRKYGCGSIRTLTTMSSPYSPCPATRSFLPSSNPAGHLDVDVPVADPQADRPADGRGQERDSGLDLDGLRGRLSPRPAPAPPPPAPAERAEQVLEPPAPATPAAAEHPAEHLLGHLRVDLLRRRSRRELEPAPPGKAAREPAAPGGTSVPNWSYIDFFFGSLRVS